jgi:hypothetical protein
MSQPNTLRIESCDQEVGTLGLHPVDPGFNTRSENRLSCKVSLSAQANSWVGYEVKSRSISSLPVTIDHTLPHHYTSYAESLTA